MYALSDIPAARPHAAARPVSETRHVEWIAVMLFFIAAFVDMPPRLGSVGGASVMGALSVVQLFIAIGGLLAIGAYPRIVLGQMLPYGLFLGWMAATMAWAPPQMAGFQNAVVYGMFGVTVLLGGTLAGHDPDRIDGLIGRGIGWIDVIALPAVALSLIVIGLPIAGETSWFVGSRSVALIALLPLSWHLAHRSEVRGAGVRAALWLAATVLSLSRTAIAVAFVFVLLAILTRRRHYAGLLSGRFAKIAAIFCVIAALVTFVRPLRDRLFTGDLGWQVGSIGINVSGRANMWATVTESAERSPLIGQGLGTSQLAIADAFELAHPHNDYLRLWHDLGVVGLLLFVVSLVRWLGRLFIDWRAATRHRHPLAPLKLAAALALFGLLLAAITDNAIIYPFMMSPLGLLVGAGLGAPLSIRSTGSAASTASTDRSVS
jgi:O-antigen ligase